MKAAGGNVPALKLRALVQALALTGVCVGLGFAAANVGGPWVSDDDV